MKHRTTRDMTHIAVFAALISVCAWLSIPAAIPVTLQTFAVFLAVFLLGGRKGTLSVALYLIMGAVGLPVFSLFRGGPGVLFGVTGGYLLGLLPCALTLWGTERAGRGRPWAQLLFAIPALFLCYATGTLWYLFVYHGDAPLSLSALLGSCVLPFVFPDLVKLSLAVFLSHRLKKRIKHHFPLDIYS